MNTRSYYYMAIAFAVVVFTAGLMTTSNAQEQRYNRQGNYNNGKYYNHSSRGFLGVKRNPEERHGFWSNVVGVPQDIVTGTARAVNPANWNEMSRQERRQYNRQMRNQGPMGQPLSARQ